MSTPHSLFDSLQSFDLAGGRRGQFYSLPALETAGVGKVSRLMSSVPPLTAVSGALRFRP